MEIFLDTARVEEIKEAYSWGIVDGVTTNPTHIAETGKPWREVVEEICSIVDGPISVEAVSTQADKIIEEAREISKIHPNIVVKIPCIREGIKAMTVLSKEGIKINATLNFSLGQAILVAKAGATYVSPFVGRLDAIGEEGMELVRNIKTVYENYGYKTKIIVSAVRHPIHVLKAALIGADVVTMRFAILKLLFEHPLTDIGLERFLKDWEKVPK